MRRTPGSLRDERFDVGRIPPCGSRRTLTGRPVGLVSPNGQAVCPYKKKTGSTGYISLRQHTAANQGPPRAVSSKEKKE